MWKFYGMHSHCSLSESEIAEILHLISLFKGTLTFLKESHLYSEKDTIESTEEICSRLEEKR